MNAFVKKNTGSDNALENYFLELLVNKKVIDREIQEVLDVIQKSTIHPDYKHLLIIILFGRENLYFENWGTLQDGLLDVIKTGEVRAKGIDRDGLVIALILWLVEEIFDIPDEDMNAFIVLEDREDVEHTLIILMKRMLDHLEVGLAHLIAQSPHLSIKIDETLHPEFIVLDKMLHKFPETFFETEKDRIAALKNDVNTLYTKFILQKNQSNHISFWQ